MKTIEHFDAAGSKFYQNRAIPSFPISSMDLYAQHFQKVCRNFQDVKNLHQLSIVQKWESDVPFKNGILDKEYVVVVTDTALNIVYATQNIFTMNGYQPDEIIGKKPKMFQGEKTCHETSREIGIAIQNRAPFEKTITNYRKDGTIYNCWIKGAPIFNTKGDVVNFIAYEKEVA